MKAVRAERPRSLATPTRKQAVMAGRVLDRRELRKQSDLAEQQPEATAAGVVEIAAAPSEKKKIRAKAPAAPKAKRARAKKALPRMRARWGVFDGGMKQVAVFDYNQRAAAEAKIADLHSRNKGIHYLQIVKDEMPETEPAVAPLAEQAV
jgi:hypothetical protein